MERKNIILIIGIIIALIIGGTVLYDAVLGETEEASKPITAIPLEIENAPESETADTPKSTESTTTQAQTTAPTTAGGLTLFSISQENSQATFTLSELLRGSPTTVVGTTNQVAAEIAVDLNDLSAAQVGPIQINARTLVTDEDRRNQAIRNRILFTDQYEFITFTPTEITGLTGSAVPGQEITFQITGSLTIRDISQPVTFQVTAQVTADGHLTGSAVTTINRADFDLSIPSVPFVADVSEEVELALSFTAPPVT